MQTKNLYMVKEDDCDERLAWSKQYIDEWRHATDEDVTLERMVDLLDQHAENINAHDFVTTHRALGAVLFKEVWREVATKIFRRLVNFEGLHGLTGVCGCTDPKVHEKELGVRLNCWPDEPLKYE